MKLNLRELLIVTLLALLTLALTAPLVPWW